MDNHKEKSRNFHPIKSTTDIAATDEQFEELPIQQTSSQETHE